MTDTAFKYCFPLFGLLLGVAPAGDLYSQQATGATALVDEIVVTARKREESIQDVPLSVSAITAEAIERAGIDNLADIADFTAGLVYQDFGGGGLGSPVIRGQAQTDIRSVESNVGVFLDGVFVSNRGNLEFALVDIERVEVVKGPQSALYGNNTFAGAINYVTKPATDELSGHVSATAGNAGRYDIKGGVSGSLVDGVLSGRFTASYSEFDGTVDNSIGGDLGGYDEKYAMTAKLEFTPGDNFDATLFWYYGQAELDPTPGFIYLNNCGGFNAQQSAVDTGRGGTIFRYFCGDMFAPDQVTVREDVTHGNRTISSLAYLSLEWDIGDITVSSLTSAGTYKSAAVVDFFYNAPLPTPPQFRLVLIPDFGPSKDWSQELRVQSSGNDFVNWTAGAYLNQFEVRRIFGIGFPANPTQIVNNLTITDSDLWAIFAGVDFSLSERIGLRIEGRHSVDQRDVWLVRLNSGAVTPLDDEFSETTFRASLDFHSSEQTMFYASVAEGAKSGGFNNTPLPEEQTFGPESNLVYEVGSKSSLLDGALLVNGSLFFSKWSDAQILTPSQVVGNTNVTRNVGDVTTWGLEVDLTWAISENWSVLAGYAYSDPTFDDGTIDIQHDLRCATPADCGLPPGPDGIGIDVSGQRVDRSVRQTAYLSSTYSWLFSDKEIYIRGDGSFTGEQPQRSLNLQFVPSHTIVNARAGVVFDGGWEIAVWSRNLFDEEYIYSAINQPERNRGSTFSTGHVANGRTYGLTASYRFGG